LDLTKTQLRFAETLAAHNVVKASHFLPNAAVAKLKTVVNGLIIVKKEHKVSFATSTKETTLVGCAEMNL
jgi:hypothetical protein